MTKSKKADDSEQKIAELTLDLQRTRADFENYRKRVEAEKEMARGAGRASATMKFLPVVDTIERAISHLPEDLKDNEWAKSVANLSKLLDTSLKNMGIERIKAEKNMAFNPEIHDAVQLDEDTDGEHEVIDEVLQPGYTIDGVVARPAMVKVSRTNQL